MTSYLTANGADNSSVYFAQPYNIDAVGFYFTSMEDYSVKANGHTDHYGQPVEEYEIQFINGDNYRLFNELAINQATLATWFENFADIEADEDDYLKAVYLAENGYDIADILSRMRDIWLYHGRAEDYAEEIISECYDVPSQLEYYIDYEAFARDMRINGDFGVLETDQGDVLVFGH
ncbi:antirestriction protein ArdA [uncultured Cohaesibacter sp.]|uniref:antirestriction protein ArdA n=1 Tax=uncultured Cohaesibacter sp. TaxID=1002546 RepID=UPI00292E0C65|nr:antirestriction protein ArdA [uncultured Cohaesibacter sp.]